MFMLAMPAAMAALLAVYLSNSCDTVPQALCTQRHKAHVEEAGKCAENGELLGLAHPAQEGTLWMLCVLSCILLEAKQKYVDDYRREITCFGQPTRTN